MTDGQTRDPQPSSLSLTRTPPRRRWQRQPPAPIRQGAFAGDGGTTPPARPRAPEGRTRSAPGAPQRAGARRARRGSGADPPHRGEDRSRDSPRAGKAEGCPPTSEGHEPPPSPRGGGRRGRAGIRTPASATHRHGVGEGRGPRAEREERSHSARASVPRPARLWPGPGEHDVTTSIERQASGRPHAHTPAAHRGQTGGRGAKTAAGASPNGAPQASPHDPLSSLCPGDGGSKRRPRGARRTAPPPSARGTGPAPARGAAAGEAAQGRRGPARAAPPTQNANTKHERDTHHAHPRFSCAGGAGSDAALAGGGPGGNTTEPAPPRRGHTAPVTRGQEGAGARRQAAAVKGPGRGGSVPPPTTWRAQGSGTPQPPRPRSPAESVSTPISRHRMPTSGRTTTVPVAGVLSASGAGPLGPSHGHRPPKRAPSRRENGAPGGHLVDPRILADGRATRGSGSGSVRGGARTPSPFSRPGRNVLSNGVRLGGSGA